MKAKKNIQKVNRPANVNPNVWKVLKKVASEIWETYDRGATWNRQVLVSCKEFYELLLDEDGNLILTSKELVRFSQNGHIQTWANELLLDGLNLLTNKEFSLAISKFELLISMSPKMAIGYVKCSEAYKEYGDYKTALSLVKTAIELDNQQSSYYLLRSNIYSLLDQDEKAMNDLNFVLLLNNRNGEALAKRGALHLAKGEEKLALVDLKKAVATNPKELAFQHLLAQAYQRLGRMPEAYKVIRLILSENPFDAEALFRCALIRLEFKMEEFKAEEELYMARNLGHPLAEKYLLEHFNPLNGLSFGEAA